jgi:flagellar basal body-associated protein FliL
LLILLALLLVGGFAYGLWFITQNANPEKVEEAVKPVAKKEQPVEKPKPRDPDFIQEIKDAEIKVEIKEIKKGGPY